MTGDLTLILFPHGIILYCCLSALDFPTFRIPRDCRITSLELAVRPLLQLHAMYIQGASSAGFPWIQVCQYLCPLSALLFP